MMTTGLVAALACVTLKPQSLGEFGPTPSVFQTTAFPRILGNLVAVPRDTQAPFPGIPGYPAKAGNQWLVICCPHCRAGACDLVPTHTGMWCEHGCTVQRLPTGDGTYGTVTDVLCSF